MQTALQLFLKSRREGVYTHTLRDYRITLSKIWDVLGLTPATKSINCFLNSLPCSLGGKYGYFKDIGAFYNWLYSLRSSLGFREEDNPVTWVVAPKRPRFVLPRLTVEQVLSLIEQVNSVRDKAIIALFTEIGLRLCEVTNIQPTDIDWNNHTILES